MLSSQKAATIHLPTSSDGGKRRASTLNTLNLVFKRRASILFFVNDLRIRYSCDLIYKVFCHLKAVMNFLPLIVCIILAWVLRKPIIPRLVIEDETVDHYGASLLPPFVIIMDLAVQHHFSSCCDHTSYFLRAERFGHYS